MMKKIHLFWLPILWVVTVLLMVWDFFYKNPPLLDQDYGMNGPNDFFVILGLTIVEMSVVWISIHLLNKRGSFLYFSVAVMSLIFWTMINIFLTLHGGGVVMLHLLWLMVLTMIFFCVWGYSLFQSNFKDR